MILNSLFIKHLKYDTLLTDKLFILLFLNWLFENFKRFELHMYLTFYSD